LAAAHGLVLLPLPIRTSHTRLSLVFHRRFENDGGHAWLRRLLLTIARGVRADDAAIVADDED
jgi:hypothetical protein